MKYEMKFFFYHPFVHRQKKESGTASTPQPQLGHPIRTEMTDI